MPDHTRIARIPLHRTTPPRSLASVLRCRRPAALLWPVLLILNTACSWITDLELAQYRDDRFLSEYRYALGEQYVEIDGLNYCYQEFGREHDRTVVILPGLGTSIDYWQLNVPALAEHYHVLALDLPGFGKTDKPDASYDLPWICDRILAFLDAKGVERASFIGISMGGHLALLLALNHPDRVDRIVMVASCGGWPRPGPLLDLGFRTLWHEAIVTDHLRRCWPDIHRGLYRRHTPMTERIFRHQMASRADLGAFVPEGRASARALKSIFYNTCRHRLGDVRQPVLVVWGEDDCIHLPSDGKFLRDGLPASRLVVFPDAAHVVMVDQPEPFNRLILTFLGDGLAAIEDRLPSQNSS